MQEEKCCEVDKQVAELEEIMKAAEEARAEIAAYKKRIATLEAKIASARDFVFGQQQGQGS